MGSSKHILLDIALVGVLIVVFFVFKTYTSTIIDPARETQESASTNTQTETSDNRDTMVESSTLTEGQRGLAESLGFDTDNITITPEMIACAEEKIGAERLEEIKNGSTPSFTEGVSLLGCYRNN